MNTARRAGATSLATLSACVVAFVAIHAAAPQWAQSAGLDFWELPEATENQRREKEREKAIDTQADDLAQQIAGAESAANGVIEDRLEWAVAVDQIADMNRGRVGFLEALQVQFHPVTAERELYEQYLREKISSKLANDPTRQCEVMARISAR